LAGGRAGIAMLDRRDGRVIQHRFARMLPNNVGGPIGSQKCVCLIVVFSKGIESAIRPENALPEYPPIPRKEKANARNA
jgi:hypothetical protein